VQLTASSEEGGTTCSARFQHDELRAGSDLRRGLSSDHRGADHFSVTMDSWRRPEYRTMSYTLRPCGEWIYLPFPASQSRISANPSRSQSRLLSCHHVALHSTESCSSTPITTTGVTTCPPLLVLQSTFAVGAGQARRRSGKSEKCHIRVYPKREIRDFPIVAVFVSDRVHPGHLGVEREEYKVLRVKG
jgi:hypothetical protein